MDMHSRKDTNRLLKRQDGVVTVEFIILFPLFMLIIVGIVEFGHLFYVRHTLTNASREGARAAVVYTTSTPRDAWAIKTAEAAVANYLAGNKFVPADVKATAGTTTGSQVTVTVTSNSGFLFMDLLFPDIADKLKTVSAETTMRME